MRPASTYGALAAMIGVLSLAPAAEAAFPGRNGRIWYSHVTVDVSLAPDDDVPAPVSALESAKFTRFGVNRGPFPLFGCPPECDDYGPALAPDGRRIAFERMSEADDLVGGFPMWLVAPDGSRPRRLPVRGYSPHWSPGGRRLVFVRREASGSRSIYTMRLDGTRLRRVTNGRGDASPVWSTRGLIAFSRGATSVEGVDVFVVRPNGRGLRRLTYRGGAEPDWSPDGKRVAFQRDQNIYVMRAGGGGLRRLTSRGGSDPAWSPDGRWVAFVRGGLYAVRPNGRRLRRLLAPEPTRQDNIETYFRVPDWQPLRQRRLVGGGGG